MEGFGVKIKFYPKAATSQKNRLAIFFGGFACGEKLGDAIFDIHEEGDFAFVFDYAHFDFSELLKISKNYSKIDIAGWSFGVWVASKFLETISEKTGLKLALCGTPAAVHNSFGIPESVFEKTLENFSEENKEKFYKRVCGVRGGENKKFLSLKSAEALKLELEIFGKAFEKSPLGHSEGEVRFDFAIAAKRDAIFPLENLEKFFGQNLIVCDSPHLDLEIFKKAFSLLKQARASLDVRRIASGFERAVKNYEHRAVVQKVMSQKLAQKYAKFAGKNAEGTILEIGCGTGFLTRNIADEILNQSGKSSQKLPKIILNDLTERMCEEASKYWKGEFEILEGDVSKIPPPKGLSAVVSSSTLQWIDDLEFLVSEIFSSLNSGGIFVFSTFGEDNFAELARALKTSGDSSWRPLKYFSEEKLCALLKKCGFEILESSSELIRKEFESPADVLRHMKLTGVNSAFSRFWTRKNLREFSEAYRNVCKPPECDAEECEENADKDEPGIFLTYNPIYVVAKKI